MRTKRSQQHFEIKLNRVLNKWVIKDTATNEFVPFSSFNWYDCNAWVKRRLGATMRINNEVENMITMRTQKKQDTLPKFEVTTIDKRMYFSFANSKDCLKYYEDIKKSVLCEITRLGDNHNVIRF